VRALLGAMGVLLVAVPAAEAQRGLRAFGSCAELVRFGKAHADDRVPVRVMQTDAVTLTMPAPRPEPGAPQPQAAASADAGRAEEEVSGTNVQEAGIDEPDVVKPVGGRLLVATPGRLLAVRATGGAPEVLGSLELDGFSHELLVRGTTALVLGHGPQGATLTEVDVADPAAMRVRRTMAVPGSIVTARQDGGTARVVVNAPPPQGEDPRLPELVPRTTLASRVSGRTFKRRVVACDDVRRPRVPGGADLLTVLTIDLDRGLFSVDRDGVMASGQAVYATAGSLYVVSATPDDRTFVHRFDASDPRVTRYRSSGEVDGAVLNQFSLSQHDGHLRVATTVGREGASAITVLKEDGATLRPVGRVGGLGKGERIYAVRFLGERGYVVTFRQVDPLYTLDLSDPARPRVLGELKIEGYSAYLHPLGEDRLIGVGVDATSEGRRLGAQVSLFDVGDPRAPKRIAARGLGEMTWTEVEQDHHAFLLHKGTIVLPVNGEARILAVEGLAERGTIAHRRDGLEGQIRRSVVAGDRLLTVSGLGVAAHRLADLQPAGFAAFPQPPSTTMPSAPANASADATTSSQPSATPRH
jgi:uncharacterized secreted protein with C-terminal beta-propeller domain